MTTFSVHRAIRYTELFEGGCVSLGDAIESHYTEQFGMPNQFRRMSNGKVSFKIYKWDKSEKTGGATLYCTNGVSSHEAKLGDSAELVVALVPECDEVYSSLADLASTVLEEGHDVKHGKTWDMSGSMWNGTELSFFITLHQHEHPTALNHAGRQIEFYNAIPLTKTEADFKKASGLDSLKTQWRENRVPFWNPRRAPSSNT